MAFIPAALIFLPLISAVSVLLIKTQRSRRVVATASLCINAALAAALLFMPDAVIHIFSFSEKLELCLGIDNAAKLFCALSAAVLLIVGVFSGEYMKHGSDARFFFFYLLAAGALNGLALSGNLLTLYLFYEALTLCSMPLVLHDMTKQAVGAACKYLFYSLAGAALGLIGLIFAHYYGFTLQFISGGVLDLQRVAGHESAVLIASFCAIVGFSAKSGMFPMYSWLPTAHPVAPAPASAILSGVITKAGLFSVFRFVYQIIGTEFLRGTWVSGTWTALSMFTVLLGSVMAFRSGALKRRLAFSSVSQVAYASLGLSMLSAAGVYGAAIQMVFHSAAKDAMFLIAGAISHKTGKTRISELRGIGREMPITMCAFTLVSLALIGIPPSLGFLGKWTLLGAALSPDAGPLQRLAPVVLIIAAVFAAAYLLPVAIRAFFPGEGFAKVKRNEAAPSMLVPIVILTLAAAFGGIRPPRLTAGGFGAVYGCIALLFWIVTTLFSREYFHKSEKQVRYQFFCLLTMAATAGVFISTDLLTLFVFFEIMSLASYPLVIHDGTRPAMRAGQSYLALSVAGGMAILLGLAILRRQLGTLEIAALSQAAASLHDTPQSLYLPAALMLFGFAAKAGLFPLHFWLPKVHPAAPAPASALMSGVVIKTGVFGALIIAAFLLPGDRNTGFIILTLAAVTMLTGAVMALFSADIKRTLACSSVSQIGFMMTGVACVMMLGDHGAFALRGTLLHMMNHSAFKLILFLLAGIVYKNTHSLDYAEIRGFGRGKPLFTIAFLLSALGLCGIPLFSGYVSKHLLHEGLFEAIHMYSSGAAAHNYLQVFEYVFIVAGGLTIAYTAKLFAVLFIQKPAGETAGKYASSLSIAPIAAISLIIPVVGCAPRLAELPLSVMERMFGLHGAETSLRNISFFSSTTLISVAIGAVVFTLSYAFSKRRSGKSAGLRVMPDIEDSLIRPAIRLFCRTFLREKQEKPMSRFYSGFYSIVADDPDAPERPAELFAGTLSNALVFFAIGVTVILLYVFVYAVI